MHNAGLSHADFRTARHELVGHHVRAVEVDLLELDGGKHITDLSDRLLDAEVQFDVTADVSRTLDIRFADEARANLGFDPVDPSAAPIHRSRVLRVRDCRLLPSLGWVRWPVFYGPVYDFGRDGGEIAVTAHSMERQALGALWDTYEAKAHKKKITTVIRELLALVGDVNASVPDLDRTLPHDLVLHSTDLVWPHIKHLAASVDHHPFYDGAGRFKMRRHNQKPVVHFDESWLLTPVKPHRGTLVANTWVVLGPNPRGPKPRPRGVAFLQGQNSPAGLSRHGVAHHLVDKLELQHAKTDHDCQVVANRRALEHGTTRTDLTFDVVPPPFLEELDMVGVADPKLGHLRLRARQWNLPLAGSTAGGGQGPPTTIGTNRRTTKARIRHR